VRVPVSVRVSACYECLHGHGDVGPLPLPLPLTLTLDMGGVLCLHGHGDVGARALVLLQAGAVGRRARRARAHLVCRGGVRI